VWDTALVSRASTYCLAAVRQMSARESNPRAARASIRSTSSPAPRTRFSLVSCETCSAARGRRHNSGYFFEFRGGGTQKEAITHFDLPRRADDGASAGSDALYSNRWRFVKKYRRNHSTLCVIFPSLSDGDGRRIHSGNSN